MQGIENVALPLPLNLLTNILISLHYYIIAVFINSFAVGTSDVNLQQTGCDSGIVT
jgi:hypothetical protein